MPHNRSKRSFVNGQSRTVSSRWLCAIEAHCRTVLNRSFAPHVRETTGAGLSMARDRFYNHPKRIPPVVEIRSCMVFDLSHSAFRVPCIISCKSTDRSTCAPRLTSYFSMSSLRFTTLPYTISPRVMIPVSIIPTVQERVAGYDGQRQRQRNVFACCSECFPRASELTTVIQSRVLMSRSRGIPSSWGSHSATCTLNIHTRAVHTVHIEQVSKQFSYSIQRRRRMFA